MGAGEIQGVQLNIGAGISTIRLDEAKVDTFGHTVREAAPDDGDPTNDPSGRVGITGGLTLGLGGETLDEFNNINVMAIPLNLHLEKVGSGIWAVGGDAALRGTYDMAVLDVGVKTSLLAGEDDKALGVTLFSRIGGPCDVANVEFGKMVYEEHDAISTAGFYMMISMNLAMMMMYGGSYFRFREHFPSAERKKERSY
ncbi:MAG: hypothetical protein HY539_02230 [Deltaproteobacteria bacterium]|nr:hypothetical protein [Deltaproteobacteria bacterium]